MKLPAGVIRNHDTLPWFSDFDLGGMLRAELGVPVSIDNDAVAAALGEYHYGLGRGCDRLLVVTLGTGIGAALLCGGRPFRDGNGQHPECGHLPVLPGGERCYCGLTGCWETTASRGSLETRVERAIGTRDLNEAHSLIEPGHPALQAAFEDYGRFVGRGLEMLNVAYGPSRVVLCGSASRFLSHFAIALTAELERAPGFRNQVDIVGSALGDAVGAIGASALVHGDV